MLSLQAKIDRGRFSLDAALECDGGVTGLFGPSGSGKSTLLGIAAGLVRPDAGRIVLAGETLFDSGTGHCLPPHRRRIGLVFQDSQLFPHYSVKGNLLYGFERTPLKDRRFRFDDIVELLALGPLLQAHPRRISGGEKQRVALGRALLASPQLLLLDEPLASLDPGLKQQILPFLKRVRDELGLPMLFVSHALPEILYLTERVVFVAAGRISAAGPLHEILQQERPAEGGALGPENILAVTVESHDREGGCTLARFGELSLALPLRADQPAGTRLYVSVHPGEVALSREPIAGTSIQNQLPGRVVAIEKRGSGVGLRISAGVPLLAEITPRAAAALGVVPGDPVVCLIKTRSFEYLGDYPANGSTQSPAPAGCVLDGMP